MTIVVVFRWCHEVPAMLSETHIACVMMYVCNSICSHFARWYLCAPTFAIKMEPASSADNMVVTEVDYEELEIEDDGLVAIIDPADRDKVNQPCCVRPCDQKLWSGSSCHVECYIFSRNFEDTVS